MRFHEHLLKTGIKSEAQIVDYYIRPGIRGGENHYFIYQYVDRQNKMHEGLTIRNKPEDRLKVGGLLPIVYDPKQPEAHVSFIITRENLYRPFMSAVVFSMISLGITLLTGKLIFRAIDQTSRKPSEDLHAS